MQTTIRNSVAAGLLGLTLTGCVTTGGGGTPVVDNSFISQVQALATKVCGFLPAAQSIAALIEFNSFGSAFDLANAICAATAPPQSARRTYRKAPVVNGIVVHGRFIR